MKIKQAIASIALATAFAATFASAAEYTWTGSVDNDWTNENNWDLGSGTPGTADTALFDTTGAQTFTANNMPVDEIGTAVKLTGNGSVAFDNGGGNFKFDYGFEALDSVSLTLGGGQFIPWKQDAGETIFNEWKSSGTLDTDKLNGNGFRLDNAGASFRQTAGTVLMHGNRLLFGDNNHYYLEDGKVEAVYTLQDSRNADSSSIVMSGGVWTNTQYMNWNGPADFEIEGGVLTLGLPGGDIRSPIGELDFATGSTGSLVCYNSEQEILDFISNTNITVNGAAATADDFSITEDGGITTVGLIPEPATLGLLGIFGLVYLLRRKLNS